MINNFSELFKILRKEKKLTQEQIAEILGISPQAVSRWENAAAFPDVTLLPQIAEYFETTVDELLGVKKINKEQKVFRMYVGNDDGAVKLNKLLEDGWLVKEWHAMPDESGGYAIYMLERNKL